MTVNNNTNHQIFSSYLKKEGLFDEVFNTDSEVKSIYKKLFDLYGEHSVDDYVNLNNKAKASFFNQGITFQVYGEKDIKEKNI